MKIPVALVNLLTRDTSSNFFLTLRSANRQNVQVIRFLFFFLSSAGAEL